MDTRVTHFLNTQSVSVLGVLQNDNTIHSATLHFAYSENPLCFYTWTEKDSRKCQSLIDGATRNASLVVGFDEKEFATFQAEGSVVIATEAMLEKGWEAYGNKFADRKAGRNASDMVLLQFTPMWWRYRDLKTKPMTEIFSEEK